MHLRHLWTGWTGREYDVELGMYYHRARYYSQSLRRFIQEDPVEGSTSPYAYVHGSPLEATDPSGMMDSYEMRMTDGELAFKISISASSEARLNGLMAWGEDNYNRYASAGGAQLYATVANGDGSTREVACSTLDGACDEWLAAHGESRPLTTEETKAAKSEFHDLDATKARVTYDMSGKSAYTPGNTMHFPESMSSCHDFVTCDKGKHVGWFIHEVTHVWQYQHGVSPILGHIFSTDVFTFRDYLPLSEYLSTPSAAGLNTEEQGDWHMWHYLCLNNLQKGC